MLENYENIIIYGLGQSGISSYEKLKDRKNIFIWDDCEKKRKELEKKGYEFNEPRKWPWEKIDLLISSPGIALNFGANSFILKESKKNKIKIVGDIEVFHQELKSLGIRKKIIAVTGTNGKSTFVSVLNEILQKSGLKSCIAGNIGIPVLSLNTDEFDIIILELSSFQLELIDEFRADISVLLNVFEDHNERYGSYEAYQKTKTKIFLNQRNSDHAVFDDFYLSEKVLKEINPSPKHVLFKDNEFNDLNNKISQNGIIKKLPFEKIESPSTEFFFSNTIITGRIAISSKILNEFKFNTRFTISEDTDLFVRIACSYPKIIQIEDFHLSFMKKTLLPLIKLNIKLQLDAGAEIVMIFDSNLYDLNSKVFKSEYFLMLKNIAHWRIN